MRFESHCLKCLRAVRIFIHSFLAAAERSFTCAREEGRGVSARPLSSSPLLAARRRLEFHNTPVCEGDASPDALPAQDAALQLLPHHAFLPPASPSPPHQRKVQILFERMDLIQPFLLWG